MSFWGPKMTACIEWAKSEGCYVPGMSTLQFAAAMDELSETPHHPLDHHETAAARWLAALND